MEHTLVEKLLRQAKDGFVELTAAQKQELIESKFKRAEKYRVALDKKLDRQ